MTARRIGLLFGAATAVAAPVGCFLVTDFGDLHAASTGGGGATSTSASGSTSGGAGGSGTGGCGTDVETDPANCGACGHDCGGPGSCDKGQCTPVNIANQPFISLARGGDYLFALVGQAPGSCSGNGGRIVRHPVDEPPAGDGSFDGRSVSIANTCAFIAASPDGRYVFYDSQADALVRRCDFSSAPVACVDFATTQGNHPNGLAVVGSALYFVHAQGPDLYTVPLNAALPATPDVAATLDPALYDGFAIATNGDAVAWTYYDQGCVAFAPHASALDGGSIACADPAPGGATAVALDPQGKAFYRAATAAGAPMQLFALTGSGPSPLVPELVSPPLTGNVAADDDWVYLDAAEAPADGGAVDPASMKLWRCDKAAAALGDCKALAPAPSGAVLLVDDRYVFFTASPGGTQLYRLRK
jgi:hypothetical protein